MGDWKCPRCGKTHDLDKGSHICVLVNSSLSPGEWILHAGSEPPIDPLRDALARATAAEAERDEWKRQRDDWQATAERIAKESPLREEYDWAIERAEKAEAECDRLRAELAERDGRQPAEPARVAGAEHDLRSDDAEGLVHAIERLRGVLDVRPVETEPGAFITEERIRREIFQQLFELAYPEHRRTRGKE